METFLCNGLQFTVYSLRFTVYGLQFTAGWVERNQLGWVSQAQPNLRISSNSQNMVLVSETQQIMWQDFRLGTM